MYVWETKIIIMKKTIHLLTISLFFYACNSEVSVKVANDDNISKIFQKNCETVISYENAFCE